jgi:hypothetical protein
MAQQFTNNARTTLASTINDIATSLTIQAGAADLFPVANVNTGSIPSTNNWFKATLQDVSGNVEIIYVRTRTAGSAVFSNVLRGQEGTTARSFVAGAVVGLRITAADIQATLDLPGNNTTYVGDNTYSGANTFSGNNTFSGDTALADFSGGMTAGSIASGVTGVTQTFGNSTTELATTAFVQAALQALHPVGSIYINATNSANPSTYFGFGTWVAFGAGRVPVGFNASDPLFDSAEETGGSKDAIVVSHTHTMQQAGSHNHAITVGTNTELPYDFVSTQARFSSGPIRNTESAGVHTHSIDSTGSSGTNANLQPYITVFMWKRTA